MLKEEKIKQEINGKDKKEYSLQELIDKCNKSKKEYPYENTQDKYKDDEIWKTDPDRIRNKYEVSNYGRVKLNGEILKQIPDEKNTDWLVLEKYPSVYVYVLVAEAWLEKPEKNGWQRHHIDNDGFNNKPENLIYVQAEDHWKIHHPDSSVS